MTLFPKVLDLLKGRGADNILLIGGGIIPEEDAKKLKAMGIGRLFGPGTNTSEIVEYIESYFKKGPKH
jgi:methylmalonyl-CoA mutase C-terminal domain/subunit